MLVQARSRGGRWTGLPRRSLDTFAGPGEIKRREVNWTPKKKFNTLAGPGEIKRREVNWTPKKKFRHFCWSRRDQEEGGELDPQEEVRHFCWSRRDQEEGGELDSHEEVKHFCWSRRDQEEGGGAGPSREPGRDEQQGGGAGLWKLDFFYFRCYSTAVLRTVSLWVCSAQQLKQQLRSTLARGQWRGDTALKLTLMFWLFWRRSTASSDFRVGARGRAFILSLPSKVNMVLNVHRNHKAISLPSLPRP